MATYSQLVERLPCGDELLVSTYSDFRNLFKEEQEDYEDEVDHFNDLKLVTLKSTFTVDLKFLKGTNHDDGTYNLDVPFVFKFDIILIVPNDATLKHISKICEEYLLDNIHMDNMDRIFEHNCEPINSHLESSQCIHLFSISDLFGTGGYTVNIKEDDKISEDTYRIKPIVFR